LERENIALFDDTYNGEQYESKFPTNLISLGWLSWKKKVDIFCDEHVTKEDVAIASKIEKKCVIILLSSNGDEKALFNDTWNAAFLESGFFNIWDPRHGFATKIGIHTNYTNHEECLIERVSNVSFSVSAYWED